MSKPIKKPLHKRWWMWLIGFFLIFNIVGIIMVDTEEEAEAENTNNPKLEGKELEDNKKERVRELLDELITDKDGFIIDIDYDNESENGNQMKVIVSDTWYELKPHEKEKFSDAIGDSVKKTLQNVGIIEIGKSTIVDIHNESGKVVAKNKLVSGKYTIKE